MGMALTFNKIRNNIPTNTTTTSVPIDENGETAVPSTTTGTTTTTVEIPSYDVVIIGAGWAGLAAAKKLLSLGITNIKVLEGRDYIGGRSVTSYELGQDNPIDLGSSWVHGRKKNPIQQIIDQNRISHAKASNYSYVAIEGPGGRVIKGHEIRTAYELYEDFSSYMEKRQARDENDTDMRSVLEDYVSKRKLKADGLDGRVGLELMIRGEITLDYAGELEDMSLWWWDDDHEAKGGDSYLAVPNGGYSSVVKEFASAVPPDVLQLECTVTGVDYQDDGDVTVSFDDGYLGVRGKKVTAKHVLVTLPLGVLKTGSVRFTPDLPMSKQKAINKLGVGLLNKCVLYWEGMSENDIFWPKNKEWIAKVDKKKEDMNGGSNWSEFYNAYKMNGGKPLLVGFIQGKEAWQMENQTDEEVTQDVLNSLRDMFGKDRVPSPTKIIVTRWGKDEFARGSYSFPQVGSNPRCRVELGKSVSNKIWFAGEATDKLFPYTTHGALRSGEVAAKQIVAQIGPNIKGGACSGKIQSRRMRLRETLRLGSQQ